MTHPDSTPTPASSQAEPSPLGLSIEQRLARQGRIGASEVAAALGLSPYQTPYELWAEKRFPRSVTEAPKGAARMGHLLEPVVAQMAQDRLPKVAVVRDGETRLYQNWLAVTPDYGLAATNGQTGVLECKTKRSRWLATRDGWGEGDGSPVPLGVLVQVVLQLEVLMDPFAIIAMLPRDEDEVQLHRITRDPTVAADVMGLAHAWWERHVRDLDPPEDIRGEEVPAILRKLFPHAVNKTVRPATEEEAAWLADLAAAKQAHKVLGARIDDTTAKLLHAIGSDYGIEGPAGKLIWFDRAGSPRYKELAEFLGATPEQVEQFRGEATRASRFTAAKEG